MSLLASANFLELIENVLVILLSFQKYIVVTKPIYYLAATMIFT